MSRTRFVHAALISLGLVLPLALAGPAGAQDVSGVAASSSGGIIVTAQNEDASTGSEAADSDTGTGSATPEPAADTTSQDVLQDLINVLQDDSARQTLLNELEKAAGSPAAPAPADDTADAADSDAAATDTDAPADDAADDAAETTVGGKVSDAVVEVSATAAETFDYMMTLWSNLPSRLEALDFSQLGVVVDTLVDVLLLLVVTYGVLISLELALRRLREFARNQALSFGPIIRYLIAASVLLGSAAAVMIAFGCGLLFAQLAARGQDYGIRPQGYLQAFVRVELFLVVVRLVLMPNMSWGRLLRLDERPARRLQGHLRVLSLWLGYGLLLLVPSLSEATTYFAGHALTLVIEMVALLYALGLIIAYRGPVAEMIAAVPEGGTPSRLRRLLARFWFWPILIWMVATISVVLLRPIFVVNRYFEASIAVALVIFCAFVIDVVAGRFLSRGVPMTGEMTERLPELQRRINAGVPKVLLAIRAVLLVGIVSFVLARFGLIDIVGFIASPTGARIMDAVIGIAIVVGVAFLIWLAIEAWIDFRLNPRSGVMPKARERTLLALLRNAAIVVLVAVAVMFGLSELGINIAPLLASAGVVGIAIGFGAQRLVQDVITGIFIQLEGAIDVGDVVTVGGTSGVVERLTIRSVALRDLQGVYHIVPFSTVDMVSNYMRGFAYVVSDLGVAYRENVDDAKQAIFDAFEQLKQNPDIRPNILDDQLEWMGLDEFGASEVVLRSRIKTQPGKQWETGRAFNAEVKKIFDARDIEIPFPHQTIYFGVDKKGEAPPMHVVKDEATSKSAAAAPKRPATRRAPAKTSKTSPAAGKKAAPRKQSTRRGSTSNMPDGDGD